MKVDKKKVGRNFGSSNKLTPEVVESICKYIRGGMNYEDSAILSGITKQTFYKWKKKGDVAKTGQYAYFVYHLEEAKRQSKAWHLQNIHKAAEGVGGAEYDEETWERNPATGVMELTKRVRKKAKRDPSCSKWILTKRFPEEFGDKLELGGEAPITTLIIGSSSNVPTSERQAAIDKMNNFIMDPPEDV